MNIVFLCGLNDFHAIDKFEVLSRVVGKQDVYILSDVVNSEGRDSLVTDKSRIRRLYNIDWMLFKTQSSFAHKWRNLIKLIVLPIQVQRLKKFYRAHPDWIYHAIPIYYMFLCWAAKVPFIGTPQGSEILVRTKRSRLYRYFAVKVLRAATRVIVDSASLRGRVSELSGVKAHVLKNGFNTTEVMRAEVPKERTWRVVSIRSLKELYRIDEIFIARKNSIERPTIAMLFPEVDDDYRSKLQSCMRVDDKVLGCLEKDEMYAVLRSTLLAVSIPASDSSPRSVYEAIFAGACVAVVRAPYLDELPKCMSERIYVVDLTDVGWLSGALKFAESTVRTPFIPSDEALDMCDENRLAQRFITEIYSPPGRGNRPADNS